MSRQSKPESAVAHDLVLSEFEEGGQVAGAESNQASAPVLEGVAGLARALRGVKVVVTASVGSAELTVEELSRVRARQVLCLDRGVDEAVDLLVNGQVVARGILVAVEDRFGVRITEIATGNGGGAAEAKEGSAHGGQP